MDRRLKRSAWIFIVLMGISMVVQFVLFAVGQPGLSSRANHEPKEITFFSRPR